MIFSTILPKQYTLDIVIPDIKQQIYFNIMQFPMQANELILNEFFKTTKHKTLKQICLQLLNDCKVALNDTEVIISFNNPSDDKLAAFITYGDAEYQGSQILRKSFANAYEGG